MGQNKKKEQVKKKHNTVVVAVVAAVNSNLSFYHLLKLMGCVFLLLKNPRKQKASS